MTLAEFITYCKIKELISVELKSENGYKMSIQTPHDGVGLHLEFDVVNGTPANPKGQYYNYTDYLLDPDRSYKMSMDEIEKVFFSTI